MLLLSALSAVLALSGGAFVFRMLRSKRGKSPTAKGMSDGLPKSLQLLLFLVSVFLLFRLLSYPFFYGTLQSFVRAIDGAMCIYGVSQVSPALFTLLNIFKLFVFFFIGQWLIFHFLTRLQATSSLAKRKLRFLLGLNIGILIESVEELIILLSVNTRTPVTCCAPNLDSPDRISAVLSRYLLGPEYEQLLLLSYYLSNLVLLGLIGYFFLGRRFEVKTKGRPLSYYTTFLAALINLFLTWLALIEVLAPRLMKLPLHHCPYCLVQYEPTSCLMIALFIMGTFAVCWAFGLETIVGHKDPVENLSVYVRKLAWFSFSCLSLSLIMVTIHLIAGSL